MKTAAILFLELFILHNSGAAQSPQRMTFQAVIRNSVGELIVDSPIGIRITILQGAADGNAVFQEIYNPNPETNANGLVSLEIGGGIAVLGAFAEIDWADGPYFLQTETDPDGGTNYSIEGVSQLLSVPYALFAEVSGSSIPGPQGPEGPQGPIGEQGPAGVSSLTYEVGDFAHGGVVFWVDETGEHGLVCSKTNQSNGVEWDNGVQRVTNSFGDGIFAGEMNTYLQIALQTNDNTTGSFAAKVAGEYSVTEGDTEYGDWYLPSKWELNKIYLAKSIISSVSQVNGGSALDDNYYWSSVEVLNSVSSWSQNFSNGGNYADGKGNIYRVRAIRRF
jgi:hypothetical protein